MSTTILAIESTCDETAASVVVDGRDVRSNVVATQVELHQKFRGVVPEIASRAHIENIVPVVNEALDRAGVKLTDVDAIAVAHRPGLIGSLLIGVTAAKTLAWAARKPLIAVDHVHAHLYSVMLEESCELRVASCEGQKQGDPKGRITAGETKIAPFQGCEKTSDAPFAPHSRNSHLATRNSPAFPAIGLVCSGGHTALYRLNGWLDVAMIGSTIDDAVGEAYDKVAAILGLPYPGGPVVDRLARSSGADARAIRFPRSMLGRESLDFSFSGLKTAVLYHVRGVPRKPRADDPPIKSPPPAPRVLAEREIADVAASFQDACVDTLLTKIRRAIRQTPGTRSVIVGGGVSANGGLRAALGGLGLPVFFPRLAYCTDNAAMSAGLAYELLRAGKTSGLELDAITYSQFRA